MPKLSFNSDFGKNHGVEYNDDLKDSAARVVFFNYSVVPGNSVELTATDDGTPPPGKRSTALPLSLAARGHPIQAREARPDRSSGCMNHCPSLRFGQLPPHRRRGCREVGMGAQFTKPEVDLIGNGIGLVFEIVGFHQPPDHWPDLVALCFFREIEVGKA